MKFVTRERTETIPGRLYSKDEYITPFAPQAYEVEEKAYNEIPADEKEIKDRKNKRSA
ncbi:MAG: hypothetical protein J6S85_02795 [Methanobrevibacter sp.]|nr:hypothetical protein [Methanobrevibacter sp.]MBO7712468.1 hypothetical protein [Methanobrevibacter sp.]